MIRDRSRGLLVVLSLILLTAVVIGVYAVSGYIDKDTGLGFADPAPEAPTNSQGIRQLPTVQQTLPQPTPGKEKHTNVFTAPPYFSLPGGFYEEAIALEIMVDHPEAEIRYTLDGSPPSALSPRYSDPIIINRTTLVRAAVYQDNHLSHSPTTQTYFIGAEHALPVISLAVSPNEFEHPTYGIYSNGPNASQTYPYIGANFWEDVEIPAHFEFYEYNNRLGFRMNVGLKIFGGWTRAYAQKSLAIYARNRYEYEEMTYPFLDNKNNIHFKHLVLRTSGQDVFRTKFKDIMITRLIQEDTDLDFQGYRQAVLYINGSYWGIYNIREKINRYFIHYNRGIDLDSFDLIEGNGIVKAGDDNLYQEMMDYIRNNDLRQEEHYAFIESIVDIDNFMDYHILQMYIGNIDIGNVRLWREKHDGGKWRWILYDTDLGFGDIQHDTVWFYINPAGAGHENRLNNQLLRGLLSNADFRDQFVKRFAYHLQYTFAPERVFSIIDALAGNIASEIPNNLERWSRPTSMNQWRSEVQVLKDFAVNRPRYVIRHLSRHLSLTQEEKALFSVN